MKKLDRFGEVKEIYARFNKVEKELLHAQLKSFESLGTRGYEHAFAVISAISKDPAVSRDKAFEKSGISLNKKGEINAAVLLIKNYLLEHLQLDVNIERPGVYNNRFRTEVSNGKKIDQARILLDRGLREQGRKLLEEVVSRSEKYELFDQNSAALKLLGFSYSTEKGLRTYKRYESYLKSAKANRDAYDRAAEVYAEFRMNQARAGAMTEADDYVRAIEVLEKIAKNSGLVYPAYHALTVKTEYLITQSEFRKAENTCMKLAETVRTAPAVQSEQRLAVALIKLTEILMQLRKFDAVENTLDELQKILKKNSFESYLVNKYKCLINFYTGRLDVLGNELPKILKSKYTLRLPYASVLFHFYLGVMHYLNGNYKAAFKLLADETDIDQAVDTEIALGQNLFLFMSAAELLKDEETSADAQAKKAVKNLEKFYESEELRKRDKVIVRLVKRIKGQEFDFKKTSTLVKDSVNRMERTDPELRWEPASYEVVPFDMWFKAKASGRKLKHKVPPAPKTEKK